MNASATIAKPATVDSVKEALNIFDAHINAANPLTVFQAFLDNGWKPLPMTKGRSDILVKDGCDLVIKCDANARKLDKTVYSAFVKELLAGQRAGVEYAHFPYIYRHRMGLTILERLEPRAEGDAELARRIELVLEHRTSQAFSAEETGIMDETPVLSVHVDLIRRINDALNVDRISVKRADIMKRADGTLVAVDVDPTDSMLAAEAEELEYLD